MLVDPMACLVDSSPRVAAFGPEPFRDVSRTDPRLPSGRIGANPNSAYAATVTTRVTISEVTSHEPLTVTMLEEQNERHRRSGGAALA